MRERIKKLKKRLFFGHSFPAKKKSGGVRRILTFSHLFQPPTWIKTLETNIFSRQFLMPKNYYESLLVARQTSMMDLFTEIINGWTPLSTLKKTLHHRCSTGFLEIFITFFLSYCKLAWKMFAPSSCISKNAWNKGLGTNVLWK